ncbi:response regulator [Desertivirga arenae]|uniref:response regulator n=1 Tax=Desertivirga arenae TaxID=2810309 RepID=UPI001A95A9FF|nr:response regulator [Pedobacter sp. SYSU D00823]
MRKFSFQQQVLTGFVITLSAIFTLVFLIYYKINTIESVAVGVDQSEQVLYHTGLLRSQLTEAETSQRGYVISNLPRFVERFNYSLHEVEPTLQKVKGILEESDEKDLSHLSDADSLAKYVILKVNHMQKVLTAFQENGLAAAKEDISDPKGKLYKDKVYSYLNKIDDREERQKKEGNMEIDGHVHNMMVIISAGCFIILCLVLVLFNYIRNSFQLQKAAAVDALENHNRLAEITRKSERQNWLLEGAVHVDAAMRGAQTTEERCQTLIVALSKILKADLGVLYTADASEKQLSLKGAYGFPMEAAKKILKPEEGLIGQTLTQREGMLFTNIPHDYIKVASGLGNSTAKSIFVQPVYNNDKLKGIIEVAFINEANPDTAEFLGNVVHSIGVALSAAEARVEMMKLFEQTQQQAEELESQHEELRTTNEELTRKTQQLQASEEELMVQQEELRQANSELEEKAELLEERNKAIEEANRAIQVKAEEVEQTSKYKSEFLANMSHELRTPLNSILILAKILRENKQKTLTEEQIKYAGVIHTAGSDLLNLINDILDLSKIESGKVDLTLEEVSIREMKVDAELLFNEVAKTKKVNFAYNIREGAPLQIVSDRQRIEQIVKNLLSNAFKFTPESGNVTVDVELAQGVEFQNEALKQAEAVIAFNVKDTGIGIPVDKQRAIFEAFQQADGSTSRKYGGTGLGLSISRELANLLKGEIKLVSEPGVGSTFTLYLPATLAETAKADSPQAAPAVTAPAPVPAVAQPAKPVPVIEKSTAGKAKLPETEKEYTLLIIEDDPNFAEILKDYATERGFKPIVANQGDTGLEMARTQKPDAIVLDIMLPVMDGWSVLKKLKEDAETYKIPVHLMSAKDETSSKARMEGAIGFLKKPVDKDQLDHAFDILIEDSGKVKINRVLLVEDQRIQSDALTNQLLSKQVDVKQAFDGEETMRILHEDQNFDCIILDLKLPDISGLDLLEKIKSFDTLVKIPVVINTAMELDQESMSRVMKYTHAMVLKSNKSNDRLLDEVNLFMNKIRTTPQSNNQENNTQAPAPKLTNTVTIEGALKNKSVLIVDDDMRNIFALTSALQEYDFEIEIANNGHEALKKLDEKPSTDIVLMDIMMPEMDGYEAMSHIRKQNRFNKLPIIALTAKAMKNDREKCIEAGANDYISKPVDIDKLISMMRVWLS